MIGAEFGHDFLLLGTYFTSRIKTVKVCCSWVGLMSKNMTLKLWLAFSHDFGMFFDIDQIHQ